MATIIIYCLVVMSCAAVFGKPVETEFYGAEASDARSGVPRYLHKIAKRFINSGLTYGEFADKSFYKLRTKRSSEEDCEKLQLCKLHAQSSRNLFAAYELYFVNKENARLWDHRARSIAACERRFGGCYEK